MEEGLSCFTEILKEDDNEAEAAVEKEAISNSEEEKKIKKNLQKEQKDAWIVKRLCQSVCGRRWSFSTSASPSVRGRRQASSAIASVRSSASSTPSAPFVLFAPSAPTVLVSGSFTPSALPALYVPLIPGSGSFVSSAPPTLSAPAVSVSEFSALSISFRPAMPVSRSSALFAPFVPFPQTPILRRRRLIELNKDESNFRRVGSYLYTSAFF